MKNQSLFSVLLLFVCVQTLTAAEPSWTAFHGPKGDNKSPETGLLKSWSEGGPKLLWKAEGIGNTEFPGYSSVTVSEGRVYTSGNVKVGDSDQTANAVIYALDARTGKEIWRYENESGWTVKSSFPGERGTPTVDGDRLYVYSAVGHLACLDAKTGKKIWDRNIRDAAEAKLPQWAYAESVYIDGDKVICWPGGVKTAVIALDKLTGKTIWETPGTQEIGNYSTMTAFDYGGLRIYANMNQKGLLTVNGKTGQRLFYHPHETQHDIMAVTPYYFDGKILVISGNATGTELLKLTVEGEKVSVEKIWEEKKFDNFHGGFVVKDGYIYGSSQRYKSGVWMCLKLEDGSIAWENRGVGMGSITYAEGLLYCYSEKDGSIALVKAIPTAYEEVGRFTVPEEGTGAYWAHPVICGQQLYLRHAGFLYCYDISAKQ